MPKHQHFNATTYSNGSKRPDTRITVGYTTFACNEVHLAVATTDVRDVVYITKQQAMEFFGLVDPYAVDHQKQAVIDELEFINNKPATTKKQFCILYANHNDTLDYDFRFSDDVEEMYKWASYQNYHCIISITERDPRLGN